VKRTGHTDEELLSVYRDYGVIPKSSRDDNFNKPSEDLSPYQLVEVGDMVMNKMKAWQGSIAISECKGIVSPAYFVYQPRPKLFSLAHPKYIHYLVRNSVYIAQYLRRSKGIRVSQWDLDPGEFQRIEVLLPPVHEQLRIANFLDHETAKIDTLIEKQQQLIALLGEKRQAVISHAVTKGLNPNASMKDSGVEWLGEVPAHWEVKSLRHTGVCQNGINIGADSFGFGYPFVSYGDVYNNRVLPERGSGLVQSTVSDREIYSVKNGDVFFTRTSETIEEIGFASTCKKTIEEATFAGFLIRFRPNRGELKVEFSSHYFSNSLLRAFFIKEMNLVTRASLSQDLLKKLPVLLPPRDEQRIIAEHLDDKVQVYTDLIAKSHRMVEILQERRTALISAAVTGKIDVRNWQPPTDKDIQ
jgi:type I restriction enzyme S subunit